MPTALHSQDLILQAIATLRDKNDQTQQPHSGMTMMDTSLPTPAAEAADSQPATDGPMGLAAVPCSVSLVDHYRKFIPSYNLGNCWITAPAEDSMAKAKAVIEKWKAKYHWEYPMKITAVKTSNFVVH